VGRDRTFTGLEPSMPCNDKENLPLSTATIYLLIQLWVYSSLLGLTPLMMS
jgi:hypothetical protein